MTSFRRLSLYATPLLLILMIAFIWMQILRPLAISFITKQIPKINTVQSVFHLEIKNINLSLLKLQLSLDGIDVTFKSDPANLSPLHINHINAQLDIFRLMVGQIAFSKIIIDGAKWSYSIQLNKSEKKITLPTQVLFKYLEMIPIDRIIAINTNLQLRIAKSDAQIHLELPQLTITNKKKELVLSLNHLNAEVIQEKKNPITFNGHLNLLLKTNDLQINDLNLNLLDSKINLSAKLHNVENLITSPEGQIQFNTKINLQDLRNLYLLLFPQKNRIPSISGFVDTTGHLNLKNFTDIQGSISASTTQVVLDQFKLGQAQVLATLNNNEVEISEIKLEHPSGHAFLKNLKIAKTSPFSFSTSLEINDFNMQKLFLSFGLNTIPAGLTADGKASCSGNIYPPTASCQVKTNIKNLWVKTNIKESFHIVKLKQVELSGETQFNKEGLTYRTDIRVGTSKGKSSGHVSYQEGFNINFESPQLNFNDIESLADINFKGLLKIRGSTHGNSDAGVINATLLAHNGEIENFRLGDFEASLDYKNTQLKLSKILGKIGKSSIEGFINFDFNMSKLDGYFNSTDLHGSDVLHILNKKFPLPFELTGNGKAELKLSGPFNFWKLTYDLKSHLKNGSFAGENFSLLNLDLSADSHNIMFKNARLKKIKSEALLIGSINTDPVEPQFDLKIKASPFLLEEIDHIIAFAPALSGVGSAEGKISGSIENPEIETNFSLREVSYDKVDYPNSQGSFLLNKKVLKFNGQFFGRQIQSDFIWPWSVNDSFSAKVLIHDLNPLFLLPLVSIPQPTADFSSNLNAEIDLVSKNRSLSSAEGSIKIKDFILRRGNQSLKLEKPSYLLFKSGLSKMENFRLKGDDSFLEVKLDSNSFQHPRFSIIADLQLRLLHFLVPFVQSLSGNLVIDSQLRLTDDSFELLGEGELNGASVTMKGFPQAIENINTPIEFSKSKIFLNDITGQLGQSDVNGVGFIEIIGAKNVQVNLRAIADNIELNFPDKILTSGKANVLFTGNWLPYNLKIDYQVLNGLVEKDFEASSEQSSSLKPSPFLPLKQIEQLSPSLSLNVMIDMTRGLLIKNKLIEGEAIGTLNISGSPETPIIKGKIDIKRGSKIIFKDKPFDVQTASISFQQTKEINPDLYISANARISDYDINLLIQGPAKNPLIKPTSQPPLSESDIFSLLALGVTSKSDQNLSSDTQQKQTGLEVLAAISNQSQLNKKIQEKLGLTVQLAPSIDSTKNIAVPKVVVSKKLSEKFNASYSKPFTGNDQNQEVKLQYLYNPKISLHLNYQNKDTIQQDQISNINTDSKGIWGLDLEYRNEFK